MVYQITLPDYMGPFEGLYHELYSNRSSLQSFALASLVEGFLSYLHDHQVASLDLDETSSFLVMTATLLEIKAHLLFPAEKPEEDEDEVPDISHDEHLAEYRHFQQVAEWLAGVGEERKQFISREPLEPVELGIPGPDPLALVTMRDLMRAFDRVYLLADDPREPEAPVYRDLWTVDEQLRWLRERLSGAGAVAFSAIFPPRSRRMMLIVTFLALLELIKLGAVGARQAAADEEIMLFWLGQNETSDQTG